MKKKSKKKTKEIQEDEYIIVQKLELDSALCSTVANKILASGQINLQTDTLIKGWLWGFFDCYSISFEFFKDKKFMKQRYYCLGGQNDTVLEKRVILANKKIIYNDFNLNAYTDTFLSMLPKKYDEGYYSQGGHTSFQSLRVLNKKESKILQKQNENKTYLASIKTQFNEYLFIQLSSRLSKEIRSECYDKYVLHFSKNNKLKRISTTSTLLGREDKRDFRKCCRKIKKVFKEMNLNFVQCKTGYTKKLSFDERSGDPNFEESDE